MIKLTPKIEQRLFQLWIVAIAGYFLWSRLNFNDHLYYFGDGTAVVEIIRLILSSHNWDPNGSRLADVIHVQPDLLPYMELPKAGEHFYHMSGYMIVGASACKIIYSLGLTELSIQTILHALNVIMQTFTLFLLFNIGKKLSSRTLGLLAATFFTAFPLAVLEAHYERPEAWLCLLTTAIIYCSLSFQALPLRQSFLIGIFIGLAIATKVSLIYLGLIPALLLICFWLDTTDGTLAERSKKACLYAALITAGIITAISINTPFILQHIPETISFTKSMARFYTTPAYPYAEEHYSYLNELLVSLRYFSLTLGALWCLLVMFGFTKIFAGYFHQPLAKKGFYLALTLPLVFFVFYSALQINFIERNYSPLQGNICLITSFGFIYLFQWSKRLLKNPGMRFLFLSAIVITMLYTPLKLDTEVVSRYIKNPGNPPRNAFQDALKKDFPGFWIKNISVIYKVTHQAPERPPKSPRVYQLDDLNDYWSRDALLALETQGFRKVAIYCSEFSHLPPNTFTLYHAAAKNHYFVREDEWPAEVPRDYFKTNCP